MDVLVWLARDTFRQSLASGIFWILLGVSAISTLVCLTARVENAPNLPSEMAEFLPRHDQEAQNAEKVKASGVTVLQGELTLAFGAIRIPLARDARQAVHLLELALAGGVADTLGFMLAIIWTAGFLPSFLEPRAASVMLAKRAPRWLLLIGKYFGVVSFVLLHAIVFVVSTWLALGVRTGVWDVSYLACIPLLLLHFAIFFSVSALLATWTHSTVVCVFGSIMFWLLSWGMNYGRHALTLAAKLEPDACSPRFRWIADACYWMLPKPADLGALLFDAVGADSDYPRLLDYAALNSCGFSMTLAVVSSALFAFIALYAAASKFNTADY
jgi:hypothetical protein